MSGQIKNVKSIILSVVLFLALIVLCLPVSALDVKTQGLQDEMQENKDISFEITLSDYSYANYISIDTDIVKKGNDPIFDFGELNEKYAGVDRYKPNVILDVPKDINSFKVKISGTTPSGIVLSKAGNIEIATFVDDNLNYYVVKLLDSNKKDLGPEQKKSKIFRLIINEKILFEENLKSIEWEELEGAKTVAKDMFYRGLVTDAKKLVSALEGIKPEGEGILPYKELWKNLLLAVVIIVTYLFGYIKGQSRRKNYGQH